ncbi:MAG TPA: glycosyltransferase family 4 protein [Azospirillum sp.]|nr:glycosyltransferase family 4 protein [Azospirillum sp.]
MRHLLVSAEFPPGPHGGIGTYAGRMARLLAGRGETVHVLTRRRHGDEPRCGSSADGRLIIHRLGPEDEVAGGWPAAGIAASLDRRYAPMRFALAVAHVGERLIREEGIDVVEGPEFEAPLYVLQLRRSVGLGPERKPPIVVHLHGASDFVFRQDLHDYGDPYNIDARRLEEFSIGAADAVLCPSRFYAAQAAIHYGLEDGRIVTLPYPLDPAGAPARDARVWSCGDILFVGRLERRKGLLEWLQAAARVARDHPRLRFAFVGQDGVGRDAIDAHLPPEVRTRFRFAGACRHAEVSGHLARARIIAVPSRWDNLPYACLEGMMAGLPVLTTRQGGMPELVGDDTEGWLAETATPDALETALRRAAATTPERLAAMGAAAHAAVRRHCDPAAVLGAHLALRRRLVADGARRSCALPDCLPFAGGLSGPPVRAPRPAGATDTAGVLLAAPGTVVNPELLEQAEAVLRTRPRVGIVTAWTERADGTVSAPPCPAFPYQLLRDETGGTAYVRAAALRAAGDPDAPPWILINRILAAGWVAVTLPGVGARASAPPPRAGYLETLGARAQAQARHPDLCALYARELILQAGSALQALPDEVTPTPRVWRHMASGALRHAREPVARATRDAVARFTRSVRAAAVRLRPRAKETP